jgi:hypothetical protein
MFKTSSRSSPPTERKRKPIADLTKLYDQVEAAEQKNDNSTLVGLTKQGNARSTNSVPNTPKWQGDWKKST